VTEHLQDSQVTALDDIAIELVEQPLRSTHPATSNRPLTGGAEHHPQPEDATHRVRGAPKLHPDLEATSQSVHRLLAPAHQVRGGRQTGQVVVGERGRIHCGLLRAPVLARMRAASADVGHEVEPSASR
jgi:hypothetical protein